LVLSSDQEETNRYADFWRYEIGVNVLPAVNKRAIVEWKKYQNSPIPKEQHNEWKEHGRFTNGLAVMLGAVWHRSDLSGYYLVGIDADNKKAIEEICTRNGQTNTLEEFASMTLIEQHRNDKSKAHIYFYAPRPFAGKSSDKNMLGDKIDKNEIPAFEIKSLGKHGIFVCSNSMHASGFRYEIIGTRKPAFLDEKHANEYEKDIDDICQKYGLDYLNQNTGDKSRIPIEDLFKPGITIEEGHNRHEALLRIMESLIARNRTILSLDDIKAIAAAWNSRVCKPPLDNTEFENQWYDAVDFITKNLTEEEESEKRRREKINEIQHQVEEKKNSLDLTSVSESARLHSGVVKVQGIVAAMFKLNKLLKGAQYQCFKCHAITEHSFVNEYGKPQLYSDIDKLGASRRCTAEGCDGTAFVKHYYYSNGIFIELRDSENLSDIDPLRAILLDDDTVNAYMHLGETVTATGLIDVLAQSKRVATSHMYIDAIEYETSSELVISSLDVKGIKRLVSKKGNELVDFLASKMFAPDIIGYNYVKKGILLIAASTNTDINDKKLNALLIGDPGLGKSELLRKAVTLVINSRYESAQNSSGKSLTAIVEKQNETSVLRMGVIPAAKGAICALNEIGRMDPDQQKHLLDVTQEQVFTINKYGINSRIKSPTAIIGSANPISGEWKDDDKIDLDEIPAIKPLLDRLDLLFIFRKNRDENTIRNYVYQKSRLDSVYAIPDYTLYLRKHIEYSKRFNPKCSSEADHMLKEYVISILKKHGSPRLRETVFKIAKMIARLKLKNIVDADDANEAMEFYNFILQQFQQVVNVTTDPRSITYHECVNVIMGSAFAMSFVEIVKSACRRNEQVRRYIGDKYDLSHNIKLRPIADLLLNNKSLKQVSLKPLAFIRIEITGYKADNNGLLYDAYDVCDDANGETEKEKTD
jgi:DNA replicative helicase MCM subunit Mcm2 (Cdc46/Mcm family)